MVDKQLGGLCSSADMDKEQTAMERLRLASQMSLKLYKQPLLLTDSGGKDSAVICRLADQKVEVNPLYGEGFCRVGCVGCPMAGKSRYAAFARWPGFQRNYIRTFNRMIDERKARGLSTEWETGEDVFHWWMEDGVLPGQIGIDWEETFDD